MNIPTRRAAAPPSAACTAAMLTALILSGCATFSKDGGFDPVATEAHARLGKDLRWARTQQEQNKTDAQVKELLAHPLSAEDAVQIALFVLPVDE